MGRRAAKLERLFDRIVSCHVIVDLSSGHPAHGYQVDIHICLPGHVVRAHHSSTDVAAIVCDRAFDEAERQVEDWVRRGRVRRHEGQAIRKSP